MPSDLSFPRAGNPKITPCSLLFLSTFQGFAIYFISYSVGSTPLPGAWFILPCQITRTMLRAQRVIIRMGLSEGSDLLSSPSNMKQSALPSHPLPPHDIFLLPSVLFCPGSWGGTFRTSEVSPCGVPYPRNALRLSVNFPKFHLKLQARCPLLGLNF